MLTESCCTIWMLCCVNPGRFTQPPDSLRSLPLYLYKTTNLLIDIMIPISLLERCKTQEALDYNNTTFPKITRINAV